MQDLNAQDTLFRKSEPMLKILYQFQRTEICRESKSREKHLLCMRRSAKCIKLFILSAFSAVCFSFVAQEVQAADIITYSDPVMNCGILVSGPIIKGDAEKLRRILAIERAKENGFELAPGAEWIFNSEIGGFETTWKWPNSLTLLQSSSPATSEYSKRICLNSNGGSFLEAIEMINQLSLYGSRVGTAIASGHVCESACALVFMAGSYQQFEDTEGRPAIDRVLHPKGVLGFHAPSLLLKDGQYTQADIARAYGVAIATIGKIVDQRNQGYELPEALLQKMLSTPPEKMYRIATVADARMADINISPSGYFTNNFPESILNVCRIPPFEANQDISNPSGLLEYRRIPQSEGAISKWSFGFVAGEGGGECNVEFGSYDMNLGSVPAIGAIGVASSWENGLKNWEEEVFPFHTFPDDTPISSLETTQSTSRERFDRLAEDVWRRRSVIQSCWLSRKDAIIVNVNEFVNLRSQPSLDSRIIGQVPRSARVQLTDTASLKGVGDKSRRDECGRACRAYSQSPNNSNAQDIALQCIDENVLWAEIKDVSGNTGWVSRKFLAEVK